MPAKSTAKKAPAKKTPAKKAVPVKKAVPAKRVAPAKKVAVKKAVPAKKAAVKQASAKRAVPAKKASAKKVEPAKKASAKKVVPAKKAPTTKAAPVKKAAAKAPVKKAPTSSKPPALTNQPAPKPPKKVKYPFDATFLEAQRVLLLGERARLVHDAEILTAEANSLAELREPGDVQFDEESGEGDTLAVERQRDIALSAQFMGQVEEIDRAMLKIGAGTYGMCEVSGLAIPKERLRAIPWARERVEYKVGGFGRR